MEYITKFIAINCLRKERFLREMNYPKNLGKLTLRV